MSTIMASSSSSTAAVAHRIWLSPTVLEKILLHLDPHTLLLCQRTSKLFSTTTTTSLPLQKKLFLHPITSPREILTLNLVQDPSSTSTFIVPHHVPPLPLKTTPASKFCLLNPFFPSTPGWGTHRSHQDLRKRPKLIGKSLCTHLELPYQGVGPQKTPRLKIPKDGKKKVEVVPSWQKMYLSQPPDLQAFPRGWNNPRVGGRCEEVCERVPRTREGGMFVVVVGERVSGEGFWEVVEREEGEFREWVDSLGGEDVEEGIVDGRNGEEILFLAGRAGEDEEIADRGNGEEGFFLNKTAEEVGSVQDGDTEEMMRDAGILDLDDAMQDTDTGILSPDDAMQDMDTTVQDTFPQTVEHEKDRSSEDTFPQVIENEKDTSSEDENSDLWRESTYYNPPTPPTPNQHSHPTTSKEPPLPLPHKIENNTSELEKLEEEIAFQKQCREYYEETMKCLEITHEEIMQTLADQQLERELEMGLGREEVEMQWD